MAFNFFGTFTTGQFLRFQVFSKYQEQDIKKRIEWLDKEIERVGKFVTKYDSNYQPISFTVVPEDSYAAKLLVAYKVFGGDPEKEMLLRTRDQPVYLNRGTALTNDPNDSKGGYGSEFTNGRLDRGGQKYDRTLGLLTNKMKKWQLDVIKRKREALEFKIKKALDHSDQLEEEKRVLSEMVAESTRDFKGLDAINSQIAGQMFADGAMNVVQNLLDIFGLRIGGVVDVTNEADMKTKDAVEGRVEGGSTNTSTGDVVEASKPSNGTSI